MREINIVLHASYADLEWGGGQGVRTRPPEKSQQYRVS